MNPNLFAKVVFKMLTFLHLTEAKWKLKRIFPKIFFQPHMERAEYFLFKKICRNKSVILEYGSGGSTIYLLKKHKFVYSVESNRDFYKYMNSIAMVNHSKGDNLKYSFVDLGPTNQWGKPLEIERSNDWEAYYKQIWREIKADKIKVDVVFIDGRFRVSCCIYSMMKVMENGWKDTVFIIHDFWRRKKYHVVLPFLDEIQSSKNLAAFTIKDGVDPGQLMAMLEDYHLATV
jgi:hypothetical protein